MTLLWFAVAAVLVMAGLLLLARARRATPPPAPVDTDPPDPSLFEPVTDPTLQPPTHWHTGDNP
jgi:hypothetical protein